MAEGVFDIGEFGQEIARMVADGTLRGVSVDIAVSAMDVMPRDEILDENGAWRDGVTRDSVEEGGGAVDLFLGPEDVLFVVWEGKSSVRRRSARSRRSRTRRSRSPRRSSPVGRRRRRTSGRRRIRPGGASRRRRSSR
jgi:hypothetical protein